MRITARSSAPAPASAVALNLAGSFPEGGEPRRGDWVIDPALHKPVGRLDLGITVSRAAPAPLRDGLPVHFHLGTEDVVGRLAVLGARGIAPGESGFVQVDLEHPIAALWGDRAIIRDHAARHTLAGGRVLDPLAPRRGRSRPERLGALAALAEPDAGDALERLVAAAGTVPLAPFAWARNLPLPEIEALADAAGLARFGTGDAAIAVSPGRLAQLGERIEAVLAEWHRAQPDTLGPTRGALFARLRGQAPEAALDAALAALVGAGRVVRDGVDAAAAVAPAAAQPRRRAALGTGAAAARRRRAAPAAGARAGRRAGRGAREADPVFPPRRALRAGRAGRAEPVFPARDACASWRSWPPRWPTNRRRAALRPPRSRTAPASAAT